MSKPIKKLDGSRAKYHYGAGLDVHKYYVTACVAVQRKVAVTKVAVQEFKQSPEGLKGLCRFLSKYLLEIVVMEATGVYTHPVKQELDACNEWGMLRPAIVVINPTLARKYPGEQHADKSDALELARLGILGLARGSFIPTGAARELRALTREIDYLERDCTRAKNRIKRVLDAWGLPLRDLELSDAWSLDLFRAIDWAGGHFGKALDALNSGTITVPRTTRDAVRRRVPAYDAFKEVTLPGTACEVLRGHLIALAFNESLIGKLGTVIETLIAGTPALHVAVGVLAGIGGLSSESAASIVAEVGNIHRFPRVKEFLQYAGCAPSIYQSGEMTKKGHLGKRVNVFLKRRFYMAGKAICVNVKEDSDLKEFGRAQMNRHWAKKERKLAFTNTGIKLARIVYTVLRYNMIYEPIHEGAKQCGERNSSAPNSPESAAMHSTTEPATQLSPPALRSLRKRARQFARYVHNVCGDNSSEWYNTLSRYFSLLESQGAINP